MNNKKKGTITSIADIATFDHFVSLPVAEMSLLTESGETITARFLPGARFNMSIDLWVKVFGGQYNTPGDMIKAFDSESVANKGRTYTTDPYISINDYVLYSLCEALFRPAVGDIVEVGWDYGSFKAEIISLAETRSPMPPELPVAGSIAFNAKDISASFGIEDKS